MTKLRRIKEIFIGLIMIVIAVSLMISPGESYEDIIFLIASYFTLRGISSIVYYLTMTRHMVGGRTTLYIGVILLDLGLLTYTLTDVPHYFVLIYLVAIHAFSGAIEVLRAFETRRLGSGSWKLKMSHGFIDIIMAIICIVFLNRLSIAVIIYAIGLIYSSLLRIVSACRRTKLIYIQ